MTSPRKNTLHTIISFVNIHAILSVVVPRKHEI